MPILTEDTDFKRMAVRFYMHPTGKLNKRKTEETGVEVYDDIEKVEIRQAGDTKFIAHYNAQEPSSWIEEHTGRRLTYAQVFPKQYAQFKQNQDQLGDGTAIAVLPGLTPAKVNQFKALGILTIEALADLEGPDLKNLGMYGREMKDAAKAFIERREKFASSKDSERKIASLEEKIAQLESMLDDRPGKKAKPKSKSMTSGSVEVSPFEDWEDENIVAWLADNGHPDADQMPPKDMRTLAEKVFKAAMKKSEAA